MFIFKFTSVSVFMGKDRSCTTPSSWSLLQQSRPRLEEAGSVGKRPSSRKALSTTTAKGCPSRGAEVCLSYQHRLLMSHSCARDSPVLPVPPAQFSHFQVGQGVAHTSPGTAPHCQHGNAQLCLQNMKFTRARLSHHTHGTKMENWLFSNCSS